MRFNQTLGSVWLDALRGIAALMVLLQHWRYAYFCELHDIHRYRKLFILPYVITSAGHGAVILFFVLSGFLVGGSALRSLEQNRWEWRRYLTHRLTRLWVVLLPALLLGGLWDAMRLHLLASHGGAPATSAYAEIARNLSWKILAANSLFLQGNNFVTFGSNSPLWSLSYEFWFYILFPLAICSFWPYFRSTIRILSLLSLFAVVLFVCKVLGASFLLLFPAWLIGTSLHYAPRRTLQAGTRWISATVYTFCFIGVVPLKLIHPYLADMGLAVATGLFMWVLICDHRVAQQHSLSVRVSRASARFSYSLYLVHLPFLLFLAAFFVRNSTWYPTPQHLSIGLAILTATIMYAWIIAKFTEFRTDTVRHWIERNLLHSH